MFSLFVGYAHEHAFCYDHVLLILNSPMFFRPFDDLCTCLLMCRIVGQVTDQKLVLKIQSPSQVSLLL